jgi:polysaccharide deacetylase 2 family uncharacterized protein YibQ
LFQRRIAAVPAGEVTGVETVPPDRAIDRASASRGSAALRWLATFWLLVAVVLAAGAVTLQVLGPLPPRAAVPGTLASMPRAATPPASPLPATSVSVRPPGAPILPPDPALQEPSPTDPAASLPRIGADGRRPSQVYAAGYDPADTRPRVAVLLAGFGMSEQDSAEAVRMLPAPVSLAVSPYALRPEPLLATARAQGHELLVAIPMEPQNYPLNDAGNEALLTSAPPGQNARRLDWALSRIAGYVGATGALGRLHGERFAAAPDQMTPVLAELADRGLLYVDPRPGTATPSGRAVDLVIDELPVRSEIDTALARLEQLAHDRGNALGLVDGPSPITNERLAAWATGLAQRGVVLVPVSALLSPRRAAP